MSTVSPGADWAAAAIERASSAHETTKSTLRCLFGSLTDREQEVVRWVAAGFMNKQTAAKMGVSEIMVKVHRGNAMKKLGATSVVDLVRIVDTLGIRSEIGLI